MEKLTRIVLCLRVLCFFTTATAVAETWVTVPAIRSAGSGVAGDVTSRVRNTFGSAHGVATRVHEDTHEINSNVRNRYQGGTEQVNAFYVLDGKAVVLAEPKPLTLNNIATTLPAALRGASYRAHLVAPQQGGQLKGTVYEGWTAPLYVLDEWAAYLNGGYYHLETGEGSYSNLKQSMEFFGYSMHLLIMVADRKRREPDWEYDIAGLARVVKYQAERTSRLYAALRRKRPGDVAHCAAWLYTLQKGQGASTTRAWMLHIYGKKWCNRFWVVTE